MWTKQGLFLREEGAGFVAYLLCAQYELAQRNKNLRYSPQDGCRDPSSLWREQGATDSLGSFDWEAHGVCCLRSRPEGSWGCLGREGFQERLRVST